MEGNYDFFAKLISNFVNISISPHQQQEELIKKITSKFNNPLDKEAYLFDIRVP